MKVRTRTIVPIHPISCRLARESSYLTASQLLLSFARLLFCHCHPPPCILIDTHALFESVFSTRRQWYIQTGLDSQLPSLISLYVFVWSISEANPKNNWMRGEQACLNGTPSCNIPSLKGGSLSSETRSNRWGKGDGRLWGREAVKLGATLTPRRRLLSDQQCSVQLLRSCLLTLRFLKSCTVLNFV